jgi:hypothetical protein
MKTIITLCLILAGTLTAFSQVATGIKASPDKKMGEFSDWQSVDVSVDGSKGTIEYRIALVDRKGIGCHYDVEVKNNLDITLKIIVEAGYYDKLVKGTYSAVFDEKVKAGKSAVGRLIAQGCKKDKGSDLDDYASCLACEFSANILVAK